MINGGRNMNFTIRKFQQSDKPELLDMMTIFYNSPAVLTNANRDILNRDIDDCISDMPFVEGFVFVNNTNGIAGYAMIAKSYSTEFGGLCIWIEDLYIKPDYRHMGLSKIFFDFIEDLYKDKAVRFRLEVEYENENACKAYNKAGFKELPYVQMTKEFI